MRTNRYRILSLVLGLALVAAACSGDDSDDGTGAADSSGGDDESTQTETDETTSTAPSTTATIPETGEALAGLRISGVHFGDDGSVVVTNLGGEDIDVDGIFLCQFPTYVDLGTIVEGGTIPAGGSAEIPAAFAGGFDEAGGEAALYQGDDFTSSDAILAFVQWGSGGARGGVAAAAGIWPGPDVTVTPDSGFGSIELFGDPADPESWG